MNRPSKTTMPLLLKNYIDYLISEEYRTQSTAEEYAGDIALFFRYIKIQCGIIPECTPYAKISLDDIDENFVHKITTNDILKFLSYLKTQRKYSGSTERRKIAAIRSYFKYAHDICKYVDIDIGQKLILPEKIDTMPIYIDDEDSMILIDSVHGRNIIRDKMIIALFLHTGIKLMELCNLNITDIDGDKLKIINAEHFDRYIILDDMLLKCFGLYLSWKYKKYIDISLNDNDKYALFLSEQKKRISPRAVQDIVFKAANNAMLNKRISPQKLRHSYAVLLYKKGFSIKEIQKLLGHENIGSTQIYLNIPELNNQENKRNFLK